MTPQRPGSWAACARRSRKAGAALRQLGAVELGRAGDRRACWPRTSCDPARLDEVILGNCAQPADAANVARVAALRAGIPERVPAFTVHRNCASGMEAVGEAADAHRRGRAPAGAGGRHESMSQIPLLFRPRTPTWLEGAGAGAGPLGAAGAVAALPAARCWRRASRSLEGLTDPVCGLNMGADRRGAGPRVPASRASAQDEFALTQPPARGRGAASGCARRSCRSSRRRPSSRCAPTSARARADAGAAGASSSRTSTAATAPSRWATPARSPTARWPCWSGEEAAARGWPVPPLGRVRAFAFAGLEPRRMGLGPVYATARALDAAGLTLADIELFEINEAFAAQVLACLAAARVGARSRATSWAATGALGDDPARTLNVNGGAIALGHPVGASGARLLLTLLHGDAAPRRAARAGRAVRGRRPGRGVRRWSVTDERASASSPCRPACRAHRRAPARSSTWSWTSPARKVNVLDGPRSRTSTPRSGRCEERPACAAWWCAAASRGAFVAGADVDAIAGSPTRRRCTRPVRRGAGDASRGWRRCPSRRSRRSTASAWAAAPSWRWRADSRVAARRAAHAASACPRCCSASSRASAAPTRLPRLIGPARPRST